MTGVVYVTAEAGQADRLSAGLRRRRDALAAHGVQVLPAGSPIPRDGRFVLVAPPTSTPGGTVRGDRAARLVVEMRPLPVTLFAAWAYEVEKHGLATRYDHWLAGVLDGSASEEYAALLHPERHVREWAHVAGAGRVTVLVAPDRRRPLRHLERRLGLSSGILSSVPLARGLTAPEADLVRVVNQRFSEEHWPGDVRTRYVDAATRALRRRGPRRPRPAPVPDRARDQVDEIAAATATAVRHLPVRVVGDPHRLEPPFRGTRVASMLPTAAAARAVAAAIAESGATARSARLDEAGPREVLAELSRRVRGRDTSG